ncbi:MAG: isocitrate lyase/PEP mutase family protein [Bacteroidota bacterium]
MQKSIVLKQLLQSDETLIMPDAYDPISARIIEYVGFKAVQCSGYSFSLSRCLRNELDISLIDNLSITKTIVDAVSVPVMADGEDGFGEGEELANNIKSFIKIGVAGINIEYQNIREKEISSRIIDKARMIEKIKTTIEVKKELNIPDFILNARTDALAAYQDRNEAIKVAIERANQYLEAGADLCFIPYVREIDEVRILSKEVKGPISIALGLAYNINKINIKQCRELGIARISLPTLAILASIKTQMNSLKSIYHSGEFDEILYKENILLDMDSLQKMVYK